MVLNTKLSRDTHVVLLERVGQTVLEDTIDESLIAVLGAVSEVGEVVRSVGHGLGSTSNDNVGGAEHNVLSTKNDGLERRSADLVHGRGDDSLGKACTEGTLAGRALSNAGGKSCQQRDRSYLNFRDHDGGVEKTKDLPSGEDIAKKDLVDILRLDTGTLDSSCG